MIHAYDRRHCPGGLSPKRHEYERRENKLDVCLSFTKAEIWRYHNRESGKKENDLKTEGKN